MKSSAEKTSTSTTSTTASQTPEKPFFEKAGGAPVQAKMTVNKPGDKFEQEADKMAHKIMRMPDPGKEEKIQRAPEEKVQKKEDDKVMKMGAKEEQLQKAEGKEEKLQKAAAKEENIQKKDEEKIQRKGNDSTSAVAANTQSAIQNKSGGGQPLPADARSYMEPRFGADFSNVRMHNDPEAASLNNQLGARAFTYQNNVFFGQDQYQPGTSEGKQLLAHELTHTIQQGHAPEASVQRSSVPGIQRQPAPAGAGLVSSGVVDITGNTFSPSAKIKEEIEAQGSKGLEVRVIIKGLTGEGRVKVRMDSQKTYDSMGKGSMPLLNEWTKQLGGMHLNFTIKNSEIKGGYASMKPGGGDSNDWLASVKKNAAVLGGVGLKVDKLPTPVNKFEGGKLTLGVTGLSVEIGGFLSSQVNLTLENLNKPVVEATAKIDVKGLAQGELKLDNTKGALAGEVTLTVSLKSFTGMGKVKYNPDGTVDIGGKAGYASDKLSGEIQFVATDLETANKFGKDAIAAAGGKENVANAGPPGPVPAPKPSSKKRALAASGQLAFNLTKWFAGAVTVVVDGNGHVTVIGKIAPPAEIILFQQKDWEKQLIKFEAKAYYGIPLVGNLNLFANIGLYALAKLGPAKIYNIEILGTYSTDPTVQKNIQIAGSINISAYAGLRLRAEGGAGIELVGHELKFGIGLNADIGVKAYADARPTIGYRDPGEFFISGTLEMVAQPMLGLGGDFFIQLDSPWWSPAPDKTWKWPLFSKEWPLSDPIGLSATIKDYVLGSGKVPDVEMKQPEFDPSKFMTSMVDDKLPAKSGGKADGKGAFKEDGSVPKPEVAPKKAEPKKGEPKSGKKGSAPAGGKSKSPDPNAAKGQGDTKGLKNAIDQLKALAGKGPITEADFNKEIAKIRASAKGVTLAVDQKSPKWTVTVIPPTAEKKKKGTPFAFEVVKGLEGKDKKDIAAFSTPKSFKVGNENHRLYPDSSGVPIVASNPKRLSDALKSLGGDVGKAVKLENINAQIKNATDPVKQADLNKKADELTADIIALLIKLKYGEGTKDTMDKAVVNFTVEGNATEFKRQIAMQQTSLTSMKVGDWQRNRARFVGFGRENKKDTKSTRREAMVAQLVSNPVDAIQSLSTNGLLTASDQSVVNGILTNPNIPDKKKALDSIARRIMDSYGSRKLAVLHRVDQVAGGDSTQYGDDASIFGGTYENSAIGRQWSTRISIVDAAAKDVKPDVAVNVELKS